MHALVPVLLPKAARGQLLSLPLLAPMALASLAVHLVAGPGEALAVHAVQAGAVVLLLHP